MAYIPRTTAPSYSDKWWRTISSGGVNPCINISNGSVLPNCFSGDTEIITDNGKERLAGIVGQTVNIPTIDGRWRPAEIKHFGRQQLWEVKLRNRHVYRATANHRWIVFSESGKTYQVVTTENLKPDMIIHYAFSGPVTYDYNNAGIRHGFVFGDGSAVSRKSSCALICGGKKSFMPEHFKDFVISEEANGTLYVGQQTPDGKQVPKLSSTYDREYLYNFLSGYFAADGCVDVDGYATITCARAELLKQIDDICWIVGIKTTGVRKQWDNGYTGYRWMYNLTLRRDSLVSSFFLNPSHRRRFESKPCKNIRRTTVVSVTKLDAIEDVYCPVEPVTHTCTLGGGELTGQCVGYAWGRFAEIQNAPCPTLPTANAGDWWELAKGFAKGSTPKLGAVAVWGKSGQAGHVAIVEQVNSDGSCVTSNSAYGGTRFYMQTLYPPSYTWGNGFYLKGFIYHPYVTGSGSVITSQSTQSSANKLSQFLNEANKHVGEGSSWTYKKSGLAVGVAWCAAFVVAVGLQVGGVIGKVIYNSFSVSTMVRQGVKNGYGTFYKGPYWNMVTSPQPGDLIVFRWNSKSSYYSQDEYFADHVGIVREVKSGVVYTVEGNSTLGSDRQERVRSHQYNLNNTCISGYYRPKWASVGGSASASSGLAYTSEPLYSSESTDEDAAVREVAYITTAGKPSISITDYKLSVVNYTSVLAALVGLPQEVLSAASEVKIDTSRLAFRNARPVFEYFNGKNLTAAQAVGVLAAIRLASEITPSAKDAVTSGIGICGWTETRKSAMMTYVGSTWQTSLTGQLNFMWYELNSTYKGVLSRIRSVDGNSVKSAVKCAIIVCEDYIKPVNKLQSVSTATQYAKTFWSQLIVVSNRSAGAIEANSDLLTYTGKVLSRGTETIVPTTLPQVGIIDYSFNLNYYSNQWKSGASHDLCTIWKEQGSASVRGVAVVDGYFLVAMPAVYGQIGDIITIVLSDGVQINCIICARPTSANSTWGNISSGLLRVVQWAKKGTADKLSAPGVRLDLTGWRDKSIYKTVNYGKYLDR